MDFKSCFLNWPQLWSWQLFDLRHQGDPWRWYRGGDQGGFQGFWQRGARLHTSAGPYRGALIKTKTTFSVMSLGEVPPFLVWYSKVMIVILIMEFWNQRRSPMQVLQKLGEKLSSDECQVMIVTTKAARWPHTLMSFTAVKIRLFSKKTLAGIDERSWHRWWRQHKLWRIRHDDV